MPQSLVAPAPTVPVRRRPDGVPAPVRDPSAAQGIPDCERLDVYRVAVEFQLVAASISTGRRWGCLRDQLDRASVSIVLNVAEGSGRFAPAEKAHFYLIARGSAMECLAVLTLLFSRGLVPSESYCKARPLLTRIVAMLTRLATSLRARG